MTNQQLIEKLGNVPIQKIGRMLVVVLPLKDWQAIEVLLEDSDMHNPPTYLRSVQSSRAEAKRGKLHEFNVRTGAFRKVSRPV